MSPNQHGREGSSAPNLQPTDTGEDVRDDGPPASVDDDLKPPPGEQSLGSPQMEPERMERQPTKTPAGSDGQKSPPARLEPLIFSPLVLNSPVRTAAPTTAQNVEKQPQESVSEEDTPTPRRPGCRPVVMSRRFTYPDTYQETMWLFDSVGTTRGQLCLLDHATDTLCPRRGSEIEEDAEMGVIF